jgi:uncharacterized membrane protein YfcA
MSELSVFEWGAAVVAVLIAGVVRGFSGFGAGLIMVPSLSLIFGPTTAVPVVVLIEVVGAVQLVPGALKSARWRSIVPLALAAGVTIPIGGTLLASLDSTFMMRGISAVVLIFALVLWTGWRYQSEPTVPATMAVGGFSGLLTGSAGIGGPPVILFFLSGPNGAPDTRANLICYFAFTQLVALGSYAIYGLLSSTVLIAAAILVPVFLLAAWIGTRLFGKVDEVWFRRATLAFLVAIAVTGLIRGGSE